MSHFLKLRGADFHYTLQKPYLAVAVKVSGKHLVLAGEPFILKGVVT